MLSVRLDPKTERCVRRLAKQKRQTKSEVVREAIELLLKHSTGQEPSKRPYELIAHLIGCVDSRGAKLSEKTGEKFAALLRENAHARHSR
ncbi:MAG: ribbon-helix-helix protein, CopG family [Nitrospirae bacterium]|nr:MAG: ribbon-helix-helix protein, CopG family [Nitrospirota bacterium]